MYVRESNICKDEIVSIEEKERERGRPLEIEIDVRII
jgi:hypothetical protein